MGCVSTKICGNSVEVRDHVVSLTSSTYGVLNLEKDNHHEQERDVSTEISVVKSAVEAMQCSSTEKTEVINVWELMEGLEEASGESVSSMKKSQKETLLLHGFGDFDPKTHLRLLAQMSSPQKAKKLTGKENKGRGDLAGNGPWREDFSPKNVLREMNLEERPLRTSNKLRVRKKSNRNDLKYESSMVGSRMVSSRRSLTLIFDPISFEEESSEDQIKEMVSPKTVYPIGRNSPDAESFLHVFEKKCPPGGENSVIVYSTTLGGIRKTFEDCNTARSIIESHHVHMIERDTSMHSGFREELRSLMGTKNVRIPLVFVKGRFIGGAEEITKLEEENKLEILFNGIPKAVRLCEGCAGIRYIICVDCNGSSKMFGSDGKRSIKCPQCNENGLIQCPICSCFF